MNHVRKQIKTLLRQRLEQSPELAGLVHVDRTIEFDPSELPCVHIHNVDTVETCKAQTATRPRRLVRTGAIHVDVLTMHSSKALNAADELAAKVESAIFGVGDELLGGLVKKLDLASTSCTQDSNVNAEIARVRLELLVEYNTLEGSPHQAA